MGGLSLLGGPKPPTPPLMAAAKLAPSMVGGALTVTGDEGICGSCICSLTELVAPVGIIGVIGDGGICGMCTMSLGPMVACITNGGDSGEVAGELTQEPDRE